MRRTISTIALFLLASITVSAQSSTFQDPLLERMTGAWILRGTIGGQETTHDVVVEWVLRHQYLRLTEVAHEKDAQGRSAYEAIVFIGWDQPSGGYACLWLDSTGGGGLTGQAIGHARRNGDTIAFLFKASDGSLFHTTFAFNREAGTWQWLMDGEEGGKLQPFARVTLTRKR